MLEITFNKQFFSHVFKNVRPPQTDQPQYLFCRQHYRSYEAEEVIDRTYRQEY